MRPGGKLKGGKGFLLTLVSSSLNDHTPSFWGRPNSSEELVCELENKDLCSNSRAGCGQISKQGKAIDFNQALLAEITKSSTDRQPCPQALSCIIWGPQESSSTLGPSSVTGLQNRGKGGLLDQMNGRETLGVGHHNGTHGQGASDRKDNQQHQLASRIKDSSRARSSQMDEG